jgi:hypothetical protein
MTDYIFHSLITDRKIRDRVVEDIALKGITEPKEILQAYQEAICFEYVKVLGATDIHIDLADMPFNTGVSSVPA